MLARKSGGCKRRQAMFGNDFMSLGVRAKNRTAPDGQCPFANYVRNSRRYFFLA
jgi:hypothetical protein